MPFLALHDPDSADLEAGVTPSAVHPVTGAFSEPSHETAFAAQLFRTAFPCHVALLALTSTILKTPRLLIKARTTRIPWRLRGVIGPHTSHTHAGPTPRSLADTDCVGLWPTHLSHEIRCLTLRHIAVSAFNSRNPLVKEHFYLVLP